MQDRFVLTTELQQYVAGNTQRVAKLICQKTDFEVQFVRVGAGRVTLERACDCQLDDRTSVL